MPQKEKKDAEETKKAVSIQITPPRMEWIGIHIENLEGSPLVSNRFGLISRNAMQEQQLAGSTARGKRKRDPKNFEAGYRDSLYTSPDGWYGFNAAAFRAAAISACRLVGFKMTFAKLAIFIEADGVSEDGQTALVRITGSPESFIAPVRNSSGVADLRARAMFRKWSMVVNVRFDADMFTRDDITNLFARIGAQVGIGAGRPDSRESAGQGWGMFRVTHVVVSGAREPEAKTA
jgi:hypothetical protein